MLCCIPRSDRPAKRLIEELSDELAGSFRGGFDDEGGPDLGEPEYEDPAEDYYFETWEEFEEYFEEIIYGLIPPEEDLTGETEVIEYDGTLEGDESIDADAFDGDLTLDEFFDLLLGDD